MPKFYQGQPIRCIWDQDRWTVNTPVEEVQPELIPTLGEVYHAGAYPSYVEHADYLELVEYGTKAIYLEDGFVPVTEDLVKQLLTTEVPTESPKAPGRNVPVPSRKEREPVDA